MDRQPRGDHAAHLVFARGDDRRPRCHPARPRSRRSGVRWRGWRRSRWRFARSSATSGSCRSVKTTGGMGLHVIVPLEPRYDYEVAKGFSELVARRVKRCCRRTRRSNGRSRAGRTTSSTSTGCRSARARPTSRRSAVRARDGAPVSMPLAWTDVEAMRRKRAPETTPRDAALDHRQRARTGREDGDPWRGGGWKPPRARPAVSRRRARSGGRRPGRTWVGYARSLPLGT